MHQSADPEPWKEGTWFSLKGLVPPNSLQSLTETANINSSQLH